MLIAIEGIDGSGKTTQVGLLTKALRALNYDVVDSKEPTDGQYGSQLRESAFTGRKTAEEELELFILDRKEHVETLIKPTIDRKGIVILDRYYFSTIAYQSARGLDPKIIQSQNEAFAPAPDVLFILDLSAEESLLRIGIRDGQGNDFEDRENLEKCRAIFNTMEAPYIHTIDASESSANIHESILNIVLNKLNQ